MGFSSPQFSTYTYGTILLMRLFYWGELWVLSSARLIWLWADRRLEFPKSTIRCLIDCEFILINDGLMAGCIVVVCFLYADFVHPFCLHRHLSYTVRHELQLRFCSFEPYENDYYEHCEPLPAIPSLLPGLKSLIWRE